MQVNPSQIGLKNQWKQFTLLVIINGFVGSMMGIERSIFPAFAQTCFGVSSKTAILSFIVAFGISKALANYLMGMLANRLGRKNILVIGWILAVPVPFMLLFASHWYIVVLANMLLGISQGLTWSSTVVMKIDLVGEKNRGFAMGLNEFAGYVAVGVMAWLTATISYHLGVRPYPFYLGIGIAFVGLMMSIVWVKDTRYLNQNEIPATPKVALKHVFFDTTFKHKTLSSITQAGLVNNLNDGMIWGLLPMMLLNFSFDQENIGMIAAIYPTVWGIGQLFTGSMSDYFNKKAMLFWGMFLQGIAILWIPFGGNFITMALLSGLLGIGTALVYPTFLNSIAAIVPAEQRAESIGVFRLWRDLGYAFGAIISGITADVFGIPNAILLIGSITLISASIVQWRIKDF